MILTAIFIIITFSIFLSVLVKILGDSKQVNVNSVFADRAENLAISGKELALAQLFELSKESSKKSSLWKNLEPTLKEPQNNKEYTILTCNNSNTAPFCDNARCKIDKVTITPRITSNDDEILNIDTPIVYEIVSKAICNVPNIENTNDNSVRISKIATATVTDVRWHNLSGL